MKNKLHARFDSDNLRKTLIYLVIAVLLIIASLFTGFAKGNSFAVILFFIGCIMFFYAALHLWEKPIYYLVLVVISIIFLLLLFVFGIDILMKMQPGKKVEDIAWTIGGICVAGFIAGFIGMLRFRKYKLNP